jgi:hypothetical protein
MLPYNLYNGTHDKHYLKTLILLLRIDFMLKLSTVLAILQQYKVSIFMKTF